LKTILLSRPASDHDVRFRYSNRPGTSIGGSAYASKLAPLRNKKAGQTIVWSAS
jgi:hypothetical protein